MTSIKPFFRKGIYKTNYEYLLIIHITDSLNYFNLIVKYKTFEKDEIL